MIQKSWFAALKIKKTPPLLNFEVKSWYSFFDKEVLGTHAQKQKKNAQNLSI